MVTLREALRSDIEGIYEIEMACFSTPWSKEALLDDLEVEDKLYLVAETEEGKIIGYAGSWLVLDEGQITNIAIHPNYRREGYGAKLTRKLTKLLAKRGMKHIFWKCVFLILQPKLCIVDWALQRWDCANNFIPLL